jgi:GT2 family glycosyltransferase
VEVSETVDVPTVTAACLLCRKDDFEKVGRFDSGFILGDFEDSDLCLRMRQLGKRVVCDNQAVFIHAEGASYPSEERQATIAYNALRHEQKWHREIDAILAAELNTS